MMFVVIGVNIFGVTVATTVQSMISSAADSKSQGQTMGAVTSLNSLMAVLAPVLGAPLLAVVSHLPPSDWRMGAPFFFVRHYNWCRFTSQCCICGSSETKTKG